MQIKPGWRDFSEKVGSMPTVMIAEDDLIMADMLAETLVEGGYEVCGIAGTVEKAVELAERHKPDLAVLDIRLAEVVWEPI